MSDFLLAQAEGELSAMRIHQALMLFDAAQRAESDTDLCAAGRWQCHMLLGNFEDAWRESDRIATRGKPDSNRFWDGRSLHNNRILIRCLHGLGDTLQFIRYAPLIRAIARSVTIEAQPKLRTLIEQSGLADNVITWSETEPPWDQQIEVMELPRIFRTTLETIPCSVPYLRATNILQSPLGAGSNSLQVGVVWTSSAFNPSRSIPIEHVASLFTIPGISFYGLQSGPEHCELSPWSLEICDLHNSVSTIHDTARVLKQLHLVISVDTMAAHLAGALGVPVWVLLPYECDWRWMLHRSDSPWYPTMRLFRQPEPGNWSAVVDQLVAHLTAVVNSSGNQKQFGADVSGGYSAFAAGAVK